MEPVGCVAIFRLQATLSRHVLEVHVRLILFMWFMNPRYVIFVALYLTFMYLYVPVVGWFFFYNLVLGLEFKKYFRQIFQKIWSRRWTQKQKLSLDPIQTILLLMRF